MKINNQAEYDAAKKTLEIPHVDFIMNAQGLRDQMLEYRRENNFFEVGGGVVKTHPKNTILWPVLRVCKNGGVCLDFKGFCWKPPRVRHATDAEIEANRRLDLPESVVKSLGEVS